MHKQTKIRRLLALRLRYFGWGTTIVIMLMTATNVFGQKEKTKLDSLQSILPGKQGAERIGILTGIIGEFIAARSYPQAQKVIGETLTEALVLGDSAQIMELYLLKASVLRRSEKLEEAAEQYRQLMPLFRRLGTMKDLAIALNGYAMTLQYMAEYKTALVYYLESANIRAMAGDKEALHIVYNNIGLLYYKLKYYEKALDYYILCDKIKDDVGSDYDRDVLYYNIALSYCFLGRFDKGMEYNRKSMFYCKGLCRLDTRVAQHYTEGIIQVGQGNPALAAKEFEISYRLAVEDEDYRYQSENMLYLGRLAISRGDFTAAVQYLRESERCAVGRRYRLLLHDTYKEMATAYHARKEYSNEFENRERYMQYRDSIFGEDLVNSLLATQVDFEQARNKAFLAVREASVARQAKQQRLMAITGALLLLVVVVFLWDIRSRRRENNYLEEQVMIRTRELASRVLASERRTAERVAWETKIIQAVNKGMASLEGLEALVKGSAFVDRIRAKIGVLHYDNGGNA